MKNRIEATVLRTPIALAFAAVVLWSLSGCGGNGSDNGEDHDEADHSHETTGEGDDHAHDESESSDDHAEDDHGHSHEFVAPTTYSGAVHMITESMESIENALAENRLADVHTKAEVVTNAARLLGKLALADGSGVSRDAIRDVNVAGRELASASNTLLELSDGGDRAKSQAEFDRMKTHIEMLMQHAGPAGDHDHAGGSGRGHGGSGHDDSDHGH